MKKEWKNAGIASLVVIIILAASYLFIEISVRNSDYDPAKDPEFQAQLLEDDGKALEMVLKKSVEDTSMEHLFFEDSYAKYHIAYTNEKGFEKSLKNKLGIKGNSVEYILNKDMEADFQMWMAKNWPDVQYRFEQTGYSDNSEGHFSHSIRIIY